MPHTSRFESVEPRHIQSGSERMRRYRDVGKYRDDMDARYLARPFIGWDGEGINLPNGAHLYVTLANSLGQRLTGSETEGIPTREAIEFLLDTAEANPGAIHVIYGGGYDVNMILGSLNYYQIQRVSGSRSAYVGDYRFSWRQGKSLTIRHKPTGRKVTLYDVLPFFQCSFIKACDGYLGSDWYMRDVIVREKARRGTFTYDELVNINEYNDAELVNLVRLCEELRQRLYRAGIRITRWDGPGAVAAALMKSYGVKAHKGESPEPVARAARFAYAGGRFELIRFGHTEQPVYEYDINSAYPDALRYVPCLAHGQWIWNDGSSKDMRPFALYHIRWRVPMDIPGPFFVRYPNGTVAYPWHGEGWYWGPEIHAALAQGLKFDILESWQYLTTCDDEPFGFIDGLYQRRRALKKSGDGAHVGIKLGLNSLYGKLAQQVGWERTPKGLRIPPFHQLEWAGFVTSSCRAKIYRAAMTAPDAVIAFETDALFTNRPLNLDIGSDLGQWEATEFRNMTYIQSGFYYATDASGNEIERTRGIDRGSLPRAAVLAAWRDGTDRVPATLSRFIGARLALRGRYGQWRRWITETRNVAMYPQGKRTHFTCSDCVGDWHNTTCFLMGDNISCEYPVEWINPDPEMVVNDEGISFDEARDEIDVYLP